MEASERADISLLLERVRGGDSAAVDTLLPMVYDELHALAGTMFRSERAGHTLQPTALVHEAWMKMAGGICQAQDRTHFFRIAAQAMRRVLTDHARKHNALKKGAGERRMTLDSDCAEIGGTEFDVLAFEDCLTRLGQLSPRHVQVVEMRVFGAMSVEEIGTVLGIGKRTVDREWALARAWLRNELAGGPMS